MTTTWKVGDHGISKSGTWTVLQVNGNGAELWVSFKGGAQERVFSHQARKLTLVEKAKRNAMGIIALIVIIAALALATVAYQAIATEAPATESLATEAPVATEAPATEAPTTEAPVATEAPTMVATETPVCTFDGEYLQNYLEAASPEAFAYNQVPADFGGHRYVIAITHTDGSHSIVYGEAGTTWTADETIARAMVNLIQDGGDETQCIANTFAKNVEPSLGEIPVMRVP